MKEADKLRMLALRSHKLSNEAEAKVEQKRQLVRTYLQQRRQLRAQLANATSISKHNQIISAINELADRIALLEDSTEVEDAAKKARAVANNETEKYVEALIAIREKYSQLEEKYKDLAVDQTVQAAIDKYGEQESKEFKLGPSSSMLPLDRKLKKLEETILSEEISLREGAGDLWYVSVVFDGDRAAEMALDTGSSIILLPWETANDLGIRPDSEAPTLHLVLADGRPVEAKSVTAKTVRVGKFTVENVECAVLPAHLTHAEPLLGQSFLKHFNFKIDPASAKLVMTRIEN